MSLPEALHDTLVEDIPPPAYSEIYGQMDMNQDGLNTHADVASMGLDPVLAEDS